mgnify:CR=1 FL=1
MRRLVDLCVRFAGTLATLTLIALALGMWTMQSAPLDVFPEFVPSTVDIQTEAPGFTAEQVEQLVTRPIELALAGMPRTTEVPRSSVAPAVTSTVRSCGVGRPLPLSTTRHRPGARPSRVARPDASFACARAFAGAASSAPAQLAAT